MFTTVLFVAMQAGNAFASYALDYISIQRTLATYPFAIDSKDFGLLNEVFTEDAVANYSAPLNILRGLPQIEIVLEKSLALVTSQHSYSTQRIDVHGATANSTTYYVANQFGKGVYEGQVVYSYGKYVDDLIRISKPEVEDGCLPEWRVQNRTLVYMGPNLGNLSIFSG